MLSKGIKCKTKKYYQNFHIAISKKPTQNYNLLANDKAFFLYILGDRFRNASNDASNLHTRLNKVYLAYGLHLVPGPEAGPGVPVGTSVTAGPLSPTSDSVAMLEQQERRLAEITGSVGTFLQEIQAFEAANEDLVDLTPAMAPLRGSDFVLTAPMGYRTSPFTEQEEFHPGVDLAAPVGTAIYAPAHGSVVFAGRYSLSRRSSWWRQGNLIAIRNGSGFVTLFGHCDEIKVRRGQRVERGDLLATVGASGWSPHSHLHYGVWRREEGGFTPVDPRLYILDHRWLDDDVVLESVDNEIPREHYDSLPRTLGGG